MVMEHRGRKYALKVESLNLRLRKFPGKDNENALISIMYTF